MKTKLSGKLSHYDKMAASAQQFFKEATACREEAARSLDQVDREGWLKLARDGTELALAAERGLFPPGLAESTHGRLGWLARCLPRLNTKRTCARAL